MTYPMSYEEYEKRVIELFFNNGDLTEDGLKRKQEFLEELKQDYPDFIKNCYEDTCYSYDEKRMKPHENTFGDTHLLSTVVWNLEMLF